MSNRLGKAVLPILILAAAFAVAAFMMANRVTPDRLEVGEKVVPVEVVEIVHGTEEVVVEGQGTVMAARQVQVRPEVSGRIFELSPSLVPGGRFAAGEVLARIDDRDYRVQLAARQEAVTRARLALREEQARQAVAEEEWELLEGSAGGPGHELALRIPQVERAESAVAAAESALDKAELDLERCTIRAPFNSIVLREQVDLGQLVGPQTEVATLVGTDAYWVRVSLPVEHLGWIEIPGRGAGGSAATVVHRAGAVEIRREGRIERLLGDVDPAGRMARLLVAISDPLNLKSGDEDPDLPLLIGSYVTVEIRGRTIDDAIVIPRRALREVRTDGAGGAPDGAGGAPDGAGGTREGLWIVDADDRLAIREAEVVWRSEDTVLVTGGLADGERLVTSALSTPIEGMKLSVASAERRGDE